MPFVMTLACFAMGMTFEESLAGATINAAWSLDRADRVGSLEPGKQADAVLVRGDAINLIRVGAPSIAGVMKRGRIVRGQFS
jgi:imidazolonepropionase